MIHPLLRLVATHPQLLADHAEAYAALVSEDLGKVATSLKRRAIYGVTALFLVCIALLFAGVALMLWAAVPESNIRAPWALIAVPAVPAVIALICAVMSMQKSPDTLSDLKQQMAADLVMLREVSAV